MNLKAYSGATGELILPPNAMALWVLAVPEEAKVKILRAENYTPGSGDPPLSIIVCDVHDTDGRYSIGLRRSDDMKWRTFSAVRYGKTAEIWLAPEFDLLTLVAGAALTIHCM